ncbi:MAG: hypothetical protein KAS48_02475 [Gammaproteobacteria bacterium]|nr:hypothetical protein [Gammaproteobacteria bacterium]
MTAIQDQPQSDLKNICSEIYNTFIETAPDIVQMIATRLGGLRGEQLLFTSDPNQNVIIVGAWWP